MPGYILVAAVAALAWLVLFADDPDSWIVGLPCIVLCALFSRSLAPAQRMHVSPVGLLRLAPYFLWYSLTGGWDVARRVLTPRLAINPGYTDFDLAISSGPARTFFVQFIGLLPGTLGAWLEGDTLRVHVLNLDADHEATLRAAEVRVAAAFAVKTDSGHDG